MNTEASLSPNITSISLSGKLGVNTNIISTKNLTKQYKKGSQDIQAINDISLEIPKGKFIAFVGKSGSGKSTLLQLIGGLDKPTAGTVMVNGTDLAKMSDRHISQFRNSTIGFVFQSFYLQPFLNVARNIEIAAMPSRMSKNERTQRIQLLATRVGLAERLEHKPHELSGGQIQRVAVARALMNNPAIIIADEPTGNLDSHTGQGIISLFQQAQSEFDTTIIIATHDRDIAEKADLVITLEDGRVV